MAARGLPGKAGGLIRAANLLPVLLSLLLISCDEQPSPKDAAIHREVTKRVETIRAEMKVAEDRRFTLRVVIFSLLTVGSIACLCWPGGDLSFQYPRRRPRDARVPPQGSASFPSSQPAPVPPAHPPIRRLDR